MKDVTHALETVQTPLVIEEDTLEIENFDEVLTEVKGFLDSINSTLVQSDDDYRWAKEQRTEIRKRVKQLDRFRIDQENELKKQIETFSNQMKSLAKEYKEADSAITGKLELFDAELWIIKQQEIEEIIKEHGKGYPIQIEDEWSLKKWTKNKLVEEIGRIATALEEQDKRDQEAIKSIETLANSLDIESEGWVQQYKDGKELTDLLNDLTLYSQRKKEEANQEEAKKKFDQVEGIEDAPKNDFLNFMRQRKAEKVRTSYLFTGTVEQQKQLEDFAKNIGFRLEVI